MIVNFIIIICLVPLPSFAEEINKDVLSIIDSLKKSTEIPRIDQNACCPACPEDKTSKGIGQGCEIHDPINSFIGSAKKYGDMLLLISGKKYAVVRDQNKKQTLIEGIRSKKKYFSLKDGRRDFQGTVNKAVENEDQKFYREYRHLRHIYRSGIRFRELCEYLSDNQQRYSSLRKKLKIKGKKKGKEGV